MQSFFSKLFLQLIIATTILVSACIIQVDPNSKDSPKEDTTQVDSTSSNNHSSSSSNSDSSLTGCNDELRNGTNEVIDDCVTNHVDSNLNKDSTECLASPWVPLPNALIGDCAEEGGILEIVYDDEGCFVDYTCEGKDTQVCPTTYDPVCASGVTYENECLAKLDGQVEWSVGECEGSSGICTTTAVMVPTPDCQISESYLPVYRDECIVAYECQVDTIPPRILSRVNDKVTVQKVSSYFHGLGPTQIFYHFEDDQAIARITIKNDEAHRATAEVYLFSKTRGVDAIKKWINNQHSDGNFVDAPEPIYEYRLNANQFSLSRESFINSTTGIWGYHWNQYQVSVDIQDVIDSRIFVLETFKDDARAFVKKDSVSIN